MGIKLKSSLCLILLFALSALAEASDDRNIYDVFGQLAEQGHTKPSPGASIEERVTARIKRHMANLLYPVDMSTFVRPDKDEKFRALIIILQRQMGAPTTGVLTSDQFDLLSQAANDIDGHLIVPETGKFVIMKNNLLTAAGTGIMDDIAHPLNRVHIVCFKDEKMCEYREASFDVQTQMLSLNDLIDYEITTWTPERVTAIREHPCGTATMTIDVKAQEAAIMTASHRGGGFCLSDKPSIWNLVDGFPVAWNLNQERITKARKLLYDPARKFEFSPTQ